VGVAWIYGQGHRFVLGRIVGYDSFVQDTPSPAIRSCVNDVKNLGGVKGEGPYQSAPKATAIMDIGPRILSHLMLDSKNVIADERMVSMDESLQM
jgi:hypothetical protein